MEEGDENNGRDSSDEKRRIMLKDFNDNSGRAVSRCNRRTVFREPRLDCSVRRGSSDPRNPVNHPEREETWSFGVSTGSQKPGKETALIKPSLDLLQGFCSLMACLPCLRIGARGGVTNSMGLVKGTVIKPRGAIAGPKHVPMISYLKCGQLYVVVRHKTVFAGVPVLFSGDGTAVASLEYFMPS